MLSFMNTFFAAWYENWFVQNAITLLVVVVIFWQMISGARRGLRKSAILFVHMLIAFTICAVFFFVMMNKFSENTIIDFVNGYMPNGMSIQSLLGVSEESNTIEKLLIEFLQIKDYEELITKIMPYINPLVELILRIVLFLISIVLYWAIKLILYIFYMLFYPKRRYKRRVEKKFNMGLGLPYNNKSFAGMFVGLVRGIIMAGIVVSLLGAPFYILSGNGEKEELIESTDENTEIINIYYFMKNSGNTGLLGVLNSVRNDEDIPYYMFFFNTVFQCELKTGNDDVDGIYYFSEEFQSYAEMFDDVIKLFIEYDVIANVEYEVSIDMDLLMELFEQETFCTELHTIIDEFKTPKLTKAILVSVIDTMLANYDAYIERTEETDLVMEIFDALFGGDDPIKVTDMFTENDLRVILHTVVSFISTYTQMSTGEESNEGQLILASKLLDTIMPYFNQLSIFTDDKAKTAFNKSLSRIVDIVLEKGMIEIDGEPITSKDLNLDSDIDWSNEIVSFTGIVCDVIVMINDNNVDFSDTTSILGLFDKTNEAYDENMEVLNDISDTISSSQILTSVFSSNLVYSAIESLVGSVVDAEISIPRDVKWGNYVENGVQKNGEFANLFDLLSSLVENGLIDLFDTETSEEIGIEQLANVIGHDNVVDCINKSDLVYYILSEILINLSIEGVELYIPQDVIYTKVLNLTDSYDLIKREEVTVIINGIKPLVSVVSSMDEGFDIASVIDNDELYNLINDSTIIGGTVVNFLLDNIASFEQIVIPDHLVLSTLDDSNMKNWLGYTDGSTEVVGELSKILDILKEVEAIKTLINGGEIGIDLITDLSEEEFDTILSSDVIYYSASNLIGTALTDVGMSIIVPLDAYTYDTNTNSYTDLIEKAELKALKNSVSVLLAEEEEETVEQPANLADSEESFDINKILDNVDTILESKILHATVVYYISYELGELISVPTNLKNVATKEYLENNAFADNLWAQLDENGKYEIGLIMDGVKSLGISLDDEELDALSIINSLDDTKLNTILASSVIWFTFSDMVINLDVEQIKVPTASTELVDVDTYIQKEEIKDLVFAVQTLNLSDLEGLNIDVIKTLTDDIDGNAQKLYNSLIISHSITNIVLDMTESEGDTVLYVPNASLENIGSTNEKMFKLTEIKNLIMAIDALGDEELDAIDANQILKLDINKLTPSLVIRYTISNVLYDMNNIKVPSSSKSDLDTTDDVEELCLSEEEIIALITAVKALVGDDGNFNSISSNSILSITDATILTNSDIIVYTISDKLFAMNEIIIPNAAIMYFDSNNTEKAITKEEISNIVDGLGELEFGNDGLSSIDANMILSLDDDSISTVLTSLVLQYTISDKMLEMEESETINIPSSVKVVLSTETAVAITTTEIKKVIISINALGLDDLNGVDANLITTMDTSKVDALTDSDIISYTISNKLFDMEDGTIVVPNVSITYFDSASIEKTIKKTELVNLIEGVITLNVDDFNSISANSIIGLSSTEIDELVESAILQYTISDKIFVLSDDDTINIPQSAYEISSGETASAITKVEIKNVIVGIQELSITDFDSVAVDKIFGDEVDISIVCESNILHYTISKKIGLVNDLSIPHAVYTTDLGDEAITASEIINLVEAMKVLDLTDVSSPDVTVLTSDELDKDVLFTSVIIRYTMSIKINDVEDGDEALLAIPSGVYETYSASYESEKGITATELKALIDSINILGISLDGSSTISTSALDSTTIADVVDSKILHYTISNKIMDLATGEQPTFIVPQIVIEAIVEGGSETGITAEEIIALVSNLDSIGIDFDSDAEFTSENVQSTIFADDVDTSKVLLATVSSVVAENFDLVASTIDTSMVADVNGNTILVIQKSEIYSLINEFNILGLNIEGDNTISATDVIGHIIVGTISLDDCSETTYYFIVTLVEDTFNSILYPSASYEHVDVTIYPMGTMETEINNVMTRTGAKEYIDVIKGSLGL